MNLTKENLVWLAELSDLQYANSLFEQESIIVDSPYGSMETWEPHKITSPQWQINILLKTIKKKNLDNQLYSLVQQRVGGGFSLLEVHPKIIIQGILKLKSEGKFD